MKSNNKAVVAAFLIVAIMAGNGQASTTTNASPSLRSNIVPDVFSKLRSRNLQDGLMSYDPTTTAIVIVDPQNDFLHPDGVAYFAVGQSVEDNDTVNNIGKLFVASRDLGYHVFVSPHWYYPYDSEWEFGGTLENVMHSIDMFARTSPTSLEGFEGSGADFLEVYKPYIYSDANNVVVTSPHKVYGPEQNDLALQLRKRHYDRIILAGMSSNLCVEAHMRDLTEEGFEVSIVSDATAGGIVEGLGDGYASSMINFRFIASSVLNTQDMLQAMGVTNPSSIVFPEPSNNINVRGRSLLDPVRDSIKSIKNMNKKPSKPMTNNVLEDLKKNSRRSLQETPPPPQFDPATTALVVIDPQNDFLSPDGVTWGLVGDSVTEHNTVENIGRLFMAADQLGYLTFVSPHWYYPYDQNWEFGGTLEKVMHEINMFARSGPLTLDGFENSGADWLDVYKPYIVKDNVIVTSPHKVYGPEQNDLALQMRKRKIDRVILAGMSSNLCVEAHMRELLEKGFEVHTVSDATAGGNVPDLGDGYEAALTNFRFMASSVLDTNTTISSMGMADPTSIVFNPTEPVAMVRPPSPGSSRLALVFKGEGQPVGTLSDINMRYKLALTPESVFGEELVSTFADDAHIGCIELPMSDPEDGTLMGTGVDCLWSIEGGVAAITFFEFSNECGLLVHAGTTSLGPFAPGVGTGPVALDGPDVDTISGAASTEGANTILDDAGKGAFEGISGNVRLSGALHMGSEPAYFNCIWEIELEMTPSCGLHDDGSTSHLLTDPEMIEKAKEPIDVGGIEDSEEDVIAAEEKVFETTGHAWVKFHGMATAIGSLDDANDMAGVDSLTLEDAFTQEQIDMLGDSMGCHSVDMVDFLSEQKIGTGIDCLWGIEGGVAAISYYVTDLGTIVNSGLTSVVPFTENVGTGSVTGNPDHPDGAAMTASFPPTTDGNTFVKTTDMYEGIKGNIRLSGIVTPGEPFYFNCVWDIYMEISPEIEQVDDDDESPNSGASSLLFPTVGLLVGLVVTAAAEFFLV